MRPFTRYLAFLACLVYTPHLFSAQLSRELTVKRIFSEGSHIAGFYSNEDLPECKWGIMYMDLSKESGKAIFALILSAKAANQKIVRIDYRVSDNETCLINGLHVQ